MFTVRFESAEQKRALQLAKNDLNTEIPQLMEILGIGVLSEAQLAYVEHARGFMGSDGIFWAPLKRATLVARVAKRGRGRKIIEKREDLAKQIRQLERSKPRIKRGRGSLNLFSKARRSQIATSRRAIRESGRAVEVKIEKLRAQRKKLRDDFVKLVDAMVANHEIGVDTGLQRASAKPGFRADDSDGGNVLAVRENAVTAGYGRSYSKHFDKKRPLLPSDLPAAWRKNLEAMTENWATGVIRRYFPR